MSNSERKTKISKEELKYEKQITTLERENRRLNKENLALKETINKTNEYIMKIVKNKTVEEIVQEVKSNDVTVKEKCPNCSAKEMKKIEGEVVIIACTNCDYRNRAHAGNQQT